MFLPGRSSTSVEVNQLSRPQRKVQLRSSSYTNFFRKGLSSKAPEVVEPLTEPYEVAKGTGILNTDYTAQVFGYLDVEKSRVKGKAPQTKNCSNRRRALHKFYTGGSAKGVNCDLYLDQNEVQERCLPNREIPARMTKEGSMAWQCKLRTVSKEDKLTVRGANPRTGMISAWMISQRGSEDSGYDSDYMDAPMMQQVRWKQDKDGWNLVQEVRSVGLEPRVKSTVPKLGGSHVLHVPSFTVVESPPMDREQLGKYQHGTKETADIYDWIESCVNPNSSPIEGEGTSPRLLQSARKEIASLVNRRRAPSMQSPLKQ